MKKIWMLVGDEYELVAKNEDTPCRLKDGSMLSLKEAIETGKEFDMWVGRWESACVSSSNYIVGELMLCLKQGQDYPSKLSDISEAICKKINDKAFLEEIGLAYINVNIKDW